MSKGEPPGCWVSPELLAQIQEEAKAADKGMAARLERAAQMAAIVRGLGYAGAYIGGTHNAEHIRWIIQRVRRTGAALGGTGRGDQLRRQGRLLFLRLAASLAPKPREFDAATSSIVHRARQHGRRLLRTVSDGHPALGRPAPGGWRKRWKTPSSPSRSRSSDARPAAIAFWA